MALLRKAAPLMRREQPTAITRNGGSRTIYGCLCGEQHSTSTEWRGRAALHVREWRSQHAGCCVTLADAYKRGDEILIHCGGSGFYRAQRRQLELDLGLD